MGQISGQAAGRALVQDVRYALRLTRRNPGFSLVAVLTLALGIGANTAIFSVIHAVFLRPLPYPEPHRLVQFHRDVGGRLQGAAQTGASYRFLHDHTRAYAHMANFMGRGGLTVAQNDRSESLSAMAVGPAYFDALGMPPARGRTFTAEEATQNGPDAVILSHALWQRLFQGDPGVLQRTILLGGKPHAVVGIMPAGFVSRPEMDVWIPLRPGPHDGGFNQRIVARLRDGVSVAQAQGELDSLAPAWLDVIGAGPVAQAELRLRLRPFQGDAAGSLTTPLLVLMVTVAIVLLIACANLANLLLARATTRLREIALRATLGASRGRLIRQLLVESLVLALLGGAGGLLLAHVTLPALLAISPVDQAFWGEIGLDARVLAFAGGLSVATGVIFGLVPALQATRVDLSQSTKEGGRASSGRHTGLLRQALIVSEVAASVALLIGALLLVQTFRNLLDVEPGFDPRRLTVAQMPMANSRYDTADAMRQFYQAGLDRIRQIPGVESAAIVLNAPMQRGLNLPFLLRTPGADGQIQQTDWRYATPDYFRVMRTPLVKGREFTERDTFEAPRVAIVNEQFVRRYLRGLDPIGQRLQMNLRPRPGEEQASLTEIVGVVRDMKQVSLSESVPETMFVPLGQVQDSVRNAHVWFPTNWVVRSVRDEGAALPEALQQALRAIDPQQPFSRIRTMESMIGQSVTTQRFNMLLVGACALLAVVLAAAGLFGVISYTVAQRGHEMGVRLALGATAGQLVGSVVRQGAALGAIGVAIGLAGAFALTRLLKAFMFGVSPTDPWTFAGAALLLLVLATLASLVPALRVMKLDPAAVFRGQ